MPFHHDDDEYKEKERPSWREIDRRRDRSRHVRRDDEYYVKKKVRTTGQAQYKAALEAFFEGEKLPQKFISAMKIELKDDNKGGNERQKLVQKIIGASTSQELVELYSEFIKKWELPDDIDMLSSLLRHPDEKVVKECLERLRKIASKRIIKKKASLENRLKQLETLSDDPQIQALAKELLRLIPKV